MLHHSYSDRFNLSNFMFLRHRATVFNQQKQLLLIVLPNSPLLHNLRSYLSTSSLNLIGELHQPFVVSCGYDLQALLPLSYLPLKFFSGCLQLTRSLSIFLSTKLSQF